MINNFKKSGAGFTLIELMIVIAIVAILVSIAVPSYNNYVLKSKRSDAIISLQTAAQSMNRCAINNNNVYSSCGFADAQDSMEGYYEITYTTNAKTYSLTATPVSGKSQAKDTECTSFTLTHNGFESSTGSLSANKCWGK